MTSLTRAILLEMALRDEGGCIAVAMTVTPSRRQIRRTNRLRAPASFLSVVRDARRRRISGEERPSTMERAGAYDQNKIAVVTGAVRALAH
jgi:hypothetical protein